jgi:hypothetical protein
MNSARGYNFWNELTIGQLIAVGPETSWCSRSAGQLRARQGRQDRLEARSWQPFGKVGLRPGGRSEALGELIHRPFPKERAAIFILPSDP